MEAIYCIIIVPNAFLKRVQAALGLAVRPGQARPGLEARRGQARPGQTSPGEPR